MSDSSSPRSVSEESIKIKYEYEPSEGEVKLEGLDELIGSLSNLSLESKCCMPKPVMKPKREEPLQKFENEAELSLKLFSKLPCIKSLSKNLVIKDYESEEALESLR